MILVDVNLLVYATVEGFPQHQQALRWLDGRLAAPERVGLPWESLLGFMRIVTSRRIIQPPAEAAAAWREIDRWLGLPGVWVPQATDRHAQVLASLIRATGAAGKLVPDAHLAALALEHGLVLCSTDGDFARFPGLRWENPLVQDTGA